MRYTKIEKIEKIVEKEIITAVNCDLCKKTIKENDLYIHLFIGSKYPECDGDSYQFCSNNCFADFIKEIDITEFYNCYTDLKTLKFKKEKEGKEE